MTFFKAVKTCLTDKYFDTSGRASRSEYWWFQLFKVLSFCFSILIISGVIALDYHFNLSGFWSVVTIFIAIFYGIYLIIPSLSVAARRMHDVGKPENNVYRTFIPLTGNIEFFIMATTASEPDNKYGPKPKE